LHKPPASPPPRPPAVIIDDDGIEEEAIDNGKTPFFLESPKMAGPDILLVTW
jgi:hypothetical protein